MHGLGPPILSHSLHAQRRTAGAPTRHRDITGCTDNMRREAAATMQDTVTMQHTDAWICFSGWGWLHMLRKGIQKCLVGCQKKETLLYSTRNFWVKYAYVYVQVTESASVYMQYWQ